MTRSLIKARISRLLARNPLTKSRWESLSTNLNTLEDINHFWWTQLGLLEAVDTSRARIALQDDLCTDDWLSNFQRFVLPTVLEHDLPVVRTNPSRY